MKKLAVLLSGNGFMDGAEIQEAVLTLLEIDRQGAIAVIAAPNRNQHHVINHLTGQEMAESRNILVEAARIARGQIVQLDELSIDDFDGLLLPGGFGAAKNFCSFAFDGSAGNVESDIEKFILDVAKSKKPIGGICVSPALISMILKDQKPTITLGPDQGTKDEIEKLGVTAKLKTAADVVIDEKNKIVTTSAYMDGNERLKDVHGGISKCVEKVIDWA
jgi:enhancing lycopene biosynthesis protein 2